MTNLLIELAAATVMAAGLTGTAYAAPTQIGSISGNECTGQGGFSNCYAFPNGTTGQGAGNGTGSPSIFKMNSDGTTASSTRFPTISGSEFAVIYTQSSNQLSFTYTPGVGDPIIHYFAISQGGSGYLYYDSAPITSATVALNSLFPNNPGYSHITFFDTGASAVPEPASWAMMILGIGGMGLALRRRSRVAASYA